MLQFDMTTMIKARMGDDLEDPVIEIRSSELIKILNSMREMAIDEPSIRVSTDIPHLLTRFKSRCDELGVEDFDKRLRAAVDKRPLKLEESINENLFKFLRRIVCSEIFEKAYIGSDRDLFSKLVSIFKHQGYLKSRDGIALAIEKLRITKSSNIRWACEQVERLVFASEVRGDVYSREDLIYKIPASMQGMDDLAESIILMIESHSDWIETNESRQQIYRKIESKFRNRRKTAKRIKASKTAK